MTVDRLYCFDTSSFIRAWHEAYPIDVVESFWTKLDNAIASGVVIAPDEVLRETKKRSDGLHGWLRERKQCFVDIDDELEEAVSELLANRPLMAQNRKGASSADAWVVALARIRRARVVSEESLTDSEKRPKIPGVCKALEIECGTLLQFMRTEGWKL
jgi:phenylpropionate dioxygenase-like ring-hydroxylating dioxygenase large terminal subunit